MIKMFEDIVGSMMLGWFMGFMLGWLIARVQTLARKEE